MSVASLSPDARETFAGLADVLIPASGDLPSARAVGVHQRWIDRVLNARPDLAEVLDALLTDAAGRDPREEIERLIDGSPAAIEALVMIVTHAYFMSPKVRKRLGYPGQKAAPPLPDEAEWYLRDGLLDPVIARGPVYRPTDYQGSSS